MYGPPTFDCKCVICGTKKNLTEADIDAVLGPCCPKCYGPMITERVVDLKGRINSLEILAKRYQDDYAGLETLRKATSGALELRAIEVDRLKIYKSVVLKILELNERTPNLLLSHVIALLRQCSQSDAKVEPGRCKYATPCWPSPCKQPGACSMADAKGEV